MSSVLPITTRNYHAKIVLLNGTRVVLHEVMFGEQVRLPNGSYAREVTPMKDGRFRLIQYKNGVRAPIDLYAQHVDRIARRGATGGLGPMPRPAPEDVDLFDIIQQGLPFSGHIFSFLGRPAFHGTDEKTGQERTILLSDIQIAETKRRKPERPPPRTEVALEALEEGVEYREVEVVITAADLVNRPGLEAVESEPQAEPEPQAEAQAEPPPSGEEA